MHVAVNNTTRQEDSDLRERVLETMKKQILKKLNNVHSNSVSKTDKTIRRGNGDALLYMETNQESNSTLRNLSSDK